MPDEDTIVFHVGGVPTAAWVLNKVIGRSSTPLRTRGVGTLGPDAVHKTITRADPKTIDVPKLAALVKTRLGRSDTHTLVMSTEAVLGGPFRSGTDGLFPDSAALLETLAAATEGLRRVIVLSACSQAYFLESFFLRMVRQKTWTTFPEWLETIDLDALSWRPVHQRLADNFGASAVHVVPFRRTKAGHAEFVARVADLISPDLAGNLAAAPRPGAELSQKGLDLGIAAAPFLPSWPDRERMREFLLQEFHDRAYPAPALLTDEQQRALADRYGDELDLVGEMR